MKESSYGVASEEITNAFWSAGPPLVVGEKQFLKVSTIVWMLKESRLKDQFSLFRHIKLRCLQDNQTPAKKVKALGLE
ncbi:hypothetical protein A2U01_0027971, partial [Trifolium medium]|nr:hypothetical protein [Trifolium medium]